MKRALFLAILLIGAVGLHQAGRIPIADVVRLFHGTPHERYAASLTLHPGNTDTDSARLWLDAASASLVEATPVTLPRQQLLSFTAGHPQAAGFAVKLRRGQRYVAEANVAGAEPTAVFLDVFERDGDAFRRVASAAPDERAVILELRSDAEYVVRVQPELRRDVRVTLALRAEPTLQLPVERATRWRIQSFFGDPRDNGRRRHHGVDIFAARGTPVVAAADGIVSSVGTNTLGGNVVWIARPLRREMHYYAHLDRQLVKAGTLVSKGDIIGTVGNTGNARRTPPHLHFGIYAAGGSVDPLPYIALHNSSNRG